MPSEALSKLTEDTVAEIRKIAGIEIKAVQQASPTLNIMVYGEPGCGKTVFAGSAAEVAAMAPVLFVDIEGGTFSLRDFYPGVDVVRIASWDEMRSLFAELHRGNHPYRTVVLDSLTEIQKFVMQQVMIDTVAKDPERDPDIPGLREWGKSGEMIRRLVRGFRDLPINVIFTALITDDKDPKTGKVTYRPALPGKLAREVPGYVDIVLYMYKKTVDSELVRAILANGDERYITKDRSNRLPTVLANPTLAEVYELMHAQKTGDQ